MISRFLAYSIVCFRALEAIGGTHALHISTLTASDNVTVFLTAFIKYHDGKILSIPPTAIRLEQKYFLLKSLSLHEE